MIDAYEIGVMLALDNGVEVGIAAIRRDLDALDRAMAVGNAGLIAIRDLADGLTMNAPIRPLPSPTISPSDEASAETVSEAFTSPLQVQLHATPQPIVVSPPARSNTPPSLPEPLQPVAFVLPPHSVQVIVPAAPLPPVQALAITVGSAIASTPTIPGGPIQQLQPLPTVQMPTPLLSISTSPIPGPASASAVAPILDTQRPTSSATSPVVVESLIAEPSFFVAPIVVGPTGIAVSETALAPIIPMETLQRLATTEAKHLMHASPSPIQASSISPPPSPPTAQQVAPVAIRPVAPISQTSQWASSDKLKNHMPRTSSTSAGDAGNSHHANVSHGEIILDSARLGRWISDHLARAATRPQSGATGFDARISPQYAGSPNGS